MSLFLFAFLVQITLFCVMTSVLLFVVTFVLTKLLIGDIQARIAWEAGLAATQYLRTVDETALIWASQQITSIPYWLPALLSRFAHIPLKDSIIFLSYFQFMAMGFALFRFAQVVTKSQLVAWLTVFFFFATDPISWNFAMAGTYRTMYAWQCALPFIFWALTAQLEERRWRQAIFLLISGLIQPPAVVYLWPAFFLFNLRLRSERSLVKRFGPVFLLGALALGPSAFLVLGHVNALPHDDVVVAMLKWAHGVPWTYPQYALLPFFATLSCVVTGAFAILAAPKILGTALKPETSPRLQIPFARLWCSLLISATLLGLLSVPGYFLKIPMFLQLMPLRAVGLVALASLPAIILFGWRQIQSEKLWMRAVVVTILVYPVVIWKKFLVLPVIIGAWFESREPKDKAFHQSLKIGFMLTLVVYATMGYFLFRSLKLQPWVKVEAQAYAVGPFMGHAALNFLALVALAVGVSITLRFVRVKRQTIMASMLIGIFAFAAFKQCLTTGLESRSTAEQNLLEAQLWAAQMTAPDAKIITLSPNILSPLCKRTPIYTQESLIEYLVTSDRLEHWRELKDFYASQANLPGYIEKVKREGFPATVSDEAAFRSLDESKVMKFAQRFGGDYLFLDKNFKKYSFPVAHENETYIFYRLLAKP